MSVKDRICKNSALNLSQNDLASVMYFVKLCLHCHKCFQQRSNPDDDAESLLKVTMLPPFFPGT